MLDAYLAALTLKDEIRTGWKLRGVDSPESVADHSWGTAYLCMLFADEARVDRTRAVEMAVIHDLAEAITGDIATRVAEMDDPTLREKKRASEAAAIARLLPGADPNSKPVASALLELWREYESVATEVARFVRDMNMIDMCAQAYYYAVERRYDDHSSEHFPDFRGMEEFFATTRPRISTEVGQRLFVELHSRYERLT
jgi:putative hydrolase of HD superfamily